MGKVDLYKELEIARGASVAEIKKAYYALARVHHPDKGGDAERFKKIQQAFDVLSDEDARRVYDMTGQIPGASEVVGAGAGGMPFGMGMGMGGGVPFDIGSLFGMFGHHMGGGGGEGGTRRRGGKPPPKVERIRLGLAHFYNGHTFQIKLDRQKMCGSCGGDGAARKEACSMCGGSGNHVQTHNMGGMIMQTRGPCAGCMGAGHKTVEKCGACSGQGKINEKRTLEGVIQPGMRSGETIVFPEACSESAEWERAGDLQLVIEEEENIYGWRRMGDAGQHLQREVEINLSEALLGVRVKLDGHPGWEEGLFIDIPAGSFTGERYMIVGQGMPIKGRINQYGDMYLMIKMVPKLMEKRLLGGEVVQRGLKEVFEGGLRKVEGAVEEDVQKELLPVKMDF